MDFYDFSDDERSVWRSDPITKAYLGLLAKCRDEHATTALDSLANGDEKAASLSTGRHFGFGLALQYAGDTK